MPIKSKYHRQIVAASLGVISGLVAILPAALSLSLIPGDVIFYSPGLAFGLFFAAYLAMLAPRRKMFWLRLLAIVFGATVIYLVSFFAGLVLGKTSGSILSGTLLAGAIGGTLVATLNLLIKPIPFRAILLSGLVGTLMGGLWIHVPPMLLYALWHGSVFCALSFFIGCEREQGSRK